MGLLAGPEAEGVGALLAPQAGERDVEVHRAILGGRQGAAPGPREGRSPPPSGSR